MKAANDKLAFSRFIKEHQKDEYGEMRITTKELARRMGMSQEMLRKIINMQKPTKKRDCIIAICLCLRMNSEDTSKALTLYNNMPQLNDMDNFINNNLETRDNTLIDLLEEQTRHYQTLDEINRILELNYHPLDIVNRKAKHKVEYSYSLINKRVNKELETLLFDFFENSLAEKYRMNKHRFTAEMLLDDKQGKVLRLVSVYSDNQHTKGYIQSEIPFKADSYHLYNTIEDTGNLKAYFLELDAMIHAEKRRLAKILNDTRNYRERSSARVINSDLHLFSEVFNYSVPEFGEYYFMDYANGKYTLYISDRSQFMRWYLAPDEYRKLYGNLQIVNKEEYSSIEDINNSIGVKKKSHHYNAKLLTKLRVNAYKKMKGNIDSLITELKEKRVLIRDIDDYIGYEMPFDFLAHFGDIESFKPIYDSDDNISALGKDKITVSVEKDIEVDLTVEDIRAGFELGLDTYKEIGECLLHNGSLVITDII